MIRYIHSLLSDIDLIRIEKLADTASWSSGKSSAGEHAESQKNNEEMDQTSESWPIINELVVGQLYRHPEFQSNALPSKVSAAFVTRCKKGMHYGIHVDDPVMGAANARYRSDIAATVFLRDPSDYDGGELNIHTPFGPVSVKLNAGSVVIYPASYLHEVTAVTRGERLACVLWAQSLVRDAEKRELLSDLDDVRKAMTKATPKALATAKTDRVYMNLLRMWSDV